MYSKLYEVFYFTGIIFSLNEVFGLRKLKALLIGLSIVLLILWFNVPGIN